MDWEKYFRLSRRLLTVLLILALAYLGKQVLLPEGLRTKVWVVTAPVAAGDRLTAANCQLVDRPQGTLPTGFLTADKRPYGRPVTANLAANTPLAPGLVAPAKDAWRTISVLVDPASAQLVKPGDTVQVWLASPAISPSPGATSAAPSNTDTSNTDPSNMASTPTAAATGLSIPSQPQLVGDNLRVASDNNKGGLFDTSNTASVNLRVDPTVADRLLALGSTRILRLVKTS